MSDATVLAPTDVIRRIKERAAFRTPEQRERVVLAAVTAVYSDYCSNSVADLDAAVVDFMGIPVERDDD